MAGQEHPKYENLRAQGWLKWAEVEEQVGQSKGNLHRWTRLLAETRVWPTDVPRPVSFPRGREGGDALYHSRAASFLRDAVALRPYAHFRGQRHSIGDQARPHAPLRILLAIRGWSYDLHVVCQDVAAVVEQFRALAGGTWAADRIGQWLFTGKAARGCGKRSAYWRAKTVALMKWLSILADSPIDGTTWEKGKGRSWDPVLRAVEASDPTDPTVLRAWVAALRPVVDGWCFPPKQPETEEEILKALTTRPALTPDYVKRENVITRIFRLLNRRLEEAYMTRPGDVERWEQIRKNLGHRLPEPLEYGRSTWYDGRLYDLHTHQVIFEVPKARSLYYPQNAEEVVTRFFRYIGVFLALGIATHDSSQKTPEPPLPLSHPVHWTCRLCNVNMHVAVTDDRAIHKTHWGPKTPPPMIRLWCPSCFSEGFEPVTMLRLVEERARGMKEPSNP